MAAPTRASSFFVALICAASVCADEGARHARDLLERWPALTISERIAEYLDASDVAALRHDFDQLDIDSDAVLDIADVLVALEGTSGRRNAKAFLSECGANCDFDAYIISRNNYDAYLNPLDFGELDTREAEFIAQLEHRVQHASPEELGLAVGPDGVIL